jgi:ribonuclease HI
MIDIEHLQQQDATRCQIEFDVKKLHEFFAAENMNILWKDYRQFELPDFIREALDQCRPVGRIDRYVIFTDGSSQTCLKHKPPVWIAENDVSDSWAFAVFAEQYGTQPGEASTLEFLGWSCQSVLYDSEAAHSIGTSRIGSDASETEALFWAGLWRLSCNNVVPTVFVSDSRLIGDQASGRCGSTIKDMPYYNLRAVFQTLHAGLPGQRLRVEHVRSHTGDPFNELVDWLAKREPRKSQYLPKQAINMQVFQPILRHLWMAAATTPDVPTLTSTGYSIPPIELPSQHLRSTPSILRTGKTLQFNISLGTANVRTFYRGEEGHPGKLQYIREQFQAHGLHFLGLQETRCDQGTSFQDQIFRIIS